MKKSIVLPFIATVLASPLTVANDASIKSFQIRCFTKLDNDKPYLYRLATANPNRTPEELAQRILNKQVRYEDEMARISSVVECRKGKDTFVDVHALKFEEEYDH
ncbi:hypothetical protein ACFSJY_17735 [Thalassotalea euphylliae]|uniref:hypothetical protein n=1 Tax=Thalassotalea euphylliae TaxID=1655234 RepID=UPI00362B1633